MTIDIREASLSDIPQLEALIARSIRTLGSGDYTAAQIDAALQGAFGVDTQLIRDRSYFVVESPPGRMVGCGGWSRRRTLFGSDARSGRDAALLDPAVDAAKIRAFFVDPDAARKGIGTALLSHCEAQAATQGFRRFELMATLPGLRLYAARGYLPGAPVLHPVAPGLTIEFVPMGKEIADTPSIEALVDAYCATWSEPDPAQRAHRLQSLWAEGATYTDPTVDALLFTDLIDHIGRVQAARPGARVRRCTQVDTHHDVLRFGFEVIGADGAVLRHGVDFVVLDSSRSRLRQVIGFFGPLRSGPRSADA